MGKPNSYALSVKKGYYFIQVALLFGQSLQTQSCGGTIIGTEWVLTAAHCTEGKFPEDIRILVGDTVLALPEEANSFIVSVAQIIQHPSYNFPSNDTSLLKLSQPLNLTSHPNIKPACLPTQVNVIGFKFLISEDCHNLHKSHKAVH